MLSCTWSSVTNKRVYSLLVAHPLHCLPALGPALLAVSEDDIVPTFGVALFTVLTMLTLV
jgi:hypothetical protein